MERMYGGELTKLTPPSILHCPFPQIIFSWAKYQWTIGQCQPAVNNLELLVEQKLKTELNNMAERVGNLQQVEELHLKSARLLLAK